MKRVNIFGTQIIIMSIILIVLSAGCKKDNEEVTTLKDIDGNAYNIIDIGTQKWLKENLKTTKFNDGSAIPEETDGSEWINMITPGMCWYNNDINNKSIYGGLYNWHAVSTAKLCPRGWHVPTDSDWKQLEIYLGMTLTNVDDTGFRGSDEGGKLKETGTVHWNSPNYGATDETGFSGRSGGFRSWNGGNFVYMGNDSYWWSSTEMSVASSWSRGLNYNVSTIDRSGLPKYYGIYVRCIKD